MEAELEEQMKRLNLEEEKKDEPKYCLDDFELVTTVGKHQ